VSAEPTQEPKHITPETCRELLSSYVDGEMPPEDRAAIERCLREHPKLAKESVMLNFKRLLANWEGVDATPDFRQRVVDQMIRESQLTASKPFLDAAAADRKQKAHAQGRAGDPARTTLDTKHGPSAVWLWILGGIMVLALAIMLLIYTQSFGRKPPSEPSQPSPQNPAGETDPQPNTQDT